jgi:hypothetical protein
MDKQIEEQHSPGCLCRYTVCVGPDPYLNPGPYYKAGERWKLYGSGSDEVWTIHHVYPDEAVIASESRPWGRRFYAFDYDSGRYASCGTPQLRIKLTDG